MNRHREETAMGVAGVCVCALLLVGCGGNAGTQGGTGGVTGTAGMAGVSGRAGAGGQAGIGGAIGSGGTTGGAGATGDCATDADCSAGQFCQGPGSGGYCALRAADTDCAGVIAGSWCFYGTTQGGVCSLSPATAGECPVGSACGTAEGATQAACYSPLVCGPDSGCGAPQFCTYVDLGTLGPTGRCLPSTFGSS